MPRIWLRHRCPSRGSRYPEPDVEPSTTPTTRPVRARDLGKKLAPATQAFLDLATLAQTDVSAVQPPPSGARSATTAPHATAPAARAGPSAERGEVRPPTGSRAPAAADPSRPRRPLRPSVARSAHRPRARRGPRRPRRPFGRAWRGPHSHAPPADPPPPAQALGRAGEVRPPTATVARARRRLEPEDAGTTVLGARRVKTQPAGLRAQARRSGATTKPNGRSGGFR